MPRIPVYSQQTTPSGSLNVDTRVGSAAGGIADLGAALAQVGADIQGRREEARKRAEESAAAAASLALSKAQADWQREFLTRAETAEAGAPDFTPNLLTDFDKSASETVAAGQTQQSSRYIKDRLTEFRGQLEGKSLVFEAKSRVEHKDQQLTQALDLRRAAVQMDPSTFPDRLAEMRAEIDASGLDGNAREAKYVGAQQALALDAALGQAASDPVGTLAALKQGPGSDKAPMQIRLLTAKGREAVEAAANGAIVNGVATKVLATYTAGGPDAGSRALALLPKSGLSPDAQRDVYQKVQSDLNLLRNQRQDAHGDDLAEVYEAISKGTAGLPELGKVEAMWRDNALTPTERASLIGRIEGAHVQGAGDAAAALALRVAAAGGLPLYPGNSEHVKALASAFGEDSKAMETGSPQFQNLAVAYATRFRMLPEQAKEWAGAAIRSPNAKIAGPAAQFVGAVQAGAPDAQSTFDAPTKAYAGMVSRMIDSGTSEKDAVETARKIMFETKPEIVEHRKAEYSNGTHALVLTNNGALNEFIDRDFDTAFSLQPVPTEALSVDFDTQTDLYYQKTGDIGLARDLAWKDLRRVYGVSEVNGEKRVMPMPPEQFGVKPEEIRGGFKDLLKENPQADGTQPEDVVVVADAASMRGMANLMNGEVAMPSYSLQGKSGAPLIYPNGVRIRYYLPSGKELGDKIRKFKEDAEARAAKQVDDARKQREIERLNAEYDPELDMMR